MLDEPAPGFWTWQARHPEWHPGEFGRLVRSWAVEVAGGVVLIHPLLPADSGETVAALDAVVAARPLTKWVRGTRDPAARVRAAWRTACSSA